ncbi:hypothetical protein MPLSOD_50113 [Mesorhizobium sp. SOD10]|nr:hypothetical protein MPLSOD_50113 [Mesorhizobium sp. SOD10]
MPKRSLSLKRECYPLTPSVIVASWLALQNLGHSLCIDTDNLRLMRYFGIRRSWRKLIQSNTLMQIPWMTIREYLESATGC